MKRAFNEQENIDLSDDLNNKKVESEMIKTYCRIRKIENDPSK